MSVCENCNRITETEEVELVAPTLFGDIGFDGNLCSDCKSMIEYCIYQYLVLNDELIEMIHKKSLMFDLETKRIMK